MAKDLKKIVEIGEEQLIHTMADLVKHQFKNGGNVLKDLDGEYNGTYYTLAEQIADQVIPPRNQDIQSILMTDTKEILESVNTVKDLNLVSKDDFYSNDIYKTIKTGIQFLVFDYFRKYQSTIKDRIFIKTCENVVEEHDKERLGDKNYILQLIEEYDCGWPLILAKGDLDKDPEIVLEAIKKDSWTIDFASKELIEKIGDNDPVEYLTNLINSDIKPKNKP